MNKNKYFKPKDFEMKTTIANTPHWLRVHFIEEGAKAEREKINKQMHKVFVYMQKLKQQISKLKKEIEKLNYIIKKEREIYAELKCNK